MSTTFLIFCRFRMILFLSLLPVLKISFFISEVENAFILTLFCRKRAGRVSWNSEGEIPVISQSSKTTPNLLVIWKSH